MNWHRLGVRSLMLAGVATAASFAAPGAEARGFIGLSLGLPVYAPAPYYAPPPAYYYAPPPAAYAPPPVYAPAPAYRYQAPNAYSGSQQCESYESTTTIDGRPQTLTGTACLQPDGTWRIVR